ncbi:hypothetical protein [Catellatospora citrea]|uniref:Uncharacterized protein n=1 Tax=Catellatospora citrea TaxID=53366 RepID=A0A8J3NYY8_9ACTN|nr:hypothetical protein [Catellatospora citrea]RKE10189.1 hypothetical protein C8E86_5083 [Catellatospora citrea]GIF97900.1 hypothetical protein Cci01nite_29940 [Catellatospora citrea]
MEEWITTAERLLTEPYAAAVTHRTDGIAEPGLHVAYLMTSQDFYDEDDHEAAESVLREYEAACGGLIAALTERWGPSERIDLGEILDSSMRGHEPTPLTAYLCNVAGGAAPLWRRGDRHVSVVVAWEDRELPVVLTLAVGRH